MYIYNKLNQIRTKTTSTIKQRIFSILWAIIMGIILGLLAKLLDSPNINPIFDDIGGRLGIWIFIATLLSVFSYSPKLSAIKIFAFFLSMLTTYYLHTTFVLHFFPQKVIIFWSICTVISPLCAYIMWYALGNRLFSKIILSFPISILMSEGFELRNAYLPIHDHYYLIPWLQIIYLIMIVILLILISPQKKQCFTTLILSFILSFILIKLNILSLLFGGMNTYLLL